MADQYPKSREELEEANAALRAQVDSLQRSIGSLQAIIVARDAEIAALKKPRAPPRVLYPDAKDAFARPYRGR